MASSLIPEVVVQVVATLSGVIVSIGVPLILSKINKINKLQTAIFGLEDVDNMSGLVGAVEAHDKEINQIKETQDSIKSDQRDIVKRVQSLNTSINSRNGDNPTSDDE